MKLVRLSLLLLLCVAACSGPSDEPAAAEAELPQLEYLSALPEEFRVLAQKKFTGDLDGMIERRLIRVGLPFNRTSYFIDKGEQKGLTYEYLRLFEDQLNEQRETGDLRIYVVPIPMPRDMLIPALRDGSVDMLVAQQTVTPERLQLVDFTAPTRSNVNEVVVTGPGAPALKSLDDLAGKQVMVRRTSSYFASLEKLNKRLEAAGKAPVEIVEAPETLEDDDLLEMANSGLIKITVVDDYLAEFWKQVFTDIRIHPGLALRRNGNLAVAVRKGSPQLVGLLNGFIAENGLDSVIGRILNRRYLESDEFVKNAAADEEQAKFASMVDLFRKYGDEYDFDYLLMAAQGYQESQLNQQAKSHVGAIGVMQLMPATGEEQNVGDVHLLEPNIHAGVKYMRFMRDRYYADEPMDDLNKALFTFASYNAGPGRIRQLRAKATEQGLDPNVWFGNVERVASENIGRETVTYVSNIFKYYVAYRLIAAERDRRAADRARLAGGRAAR